VFVLAEGVTREDADAEDELTAAALVVGTLPESPMARGGGRQRAAFLGAAPAPAWLPVGLGLGHSEGS